MRTVVFIQNRDFFGTRLIHLPLLHALKSRPDDELIVFTPFATGAFFKSAGLADEVHQYRRGFRALWRQLRELKPDRVLSLRPQSSWLNLAIGLCGARERIGYDAPLASLLMTHVQPRDTAIYRGYNYLALPRLLGVEAQLGSVFREMAAQSELSLDDGHYYCLMPGGGAGEFKRWGLENFLALAERLLQQNPAARFLWILGGDEQEYVEALESSPLADCSQLLFNASLADVSRAVLASRVTVANDCGPAHIAQMLETPVVMLFSDYDSQVQVRIDEWYNPHPQARVLTSTPGADIETIAVDEVFAAIDEVVPALAQAGLTEA